MHPMVVYYDQHCRFCVFWKRQFDRWERSPGRVEWRPFTEAAACGLDGSDCGQALELVTSEGVRYRGFYAVRRLVRFTRLFWLSPLLHLPGAAWLGERVYAWVAANRYRLGGRLE